MKPKMNRSLLQNETDIWNALIETLSGTEAPEGDELFARVQSVTHYYNELESGGHESLLNWLQEDIGLVGGASFFRELSDSLEKVGAKEYAKIERKYGEVMWKRFQALETEGIDKAEGDFLSIIEKADQEYYALADQLGTILEAYFVQIHTEIIDVEEDK